MLSNVPSRDPERNDSGLYREADRSNVTSSDPERNDSGLYREVAIANFKKKVSILNACSGSRYILASQIQLKHSNRQAGRMRNVAMSQ